MSIKNATIYPYRKGDKGIVCLPLARNIPNPKHEDWAIVRCNKCGEACWESDNARKVIADGNIAYCTACALKENFKNRGGV